MNLILVLIKNIKLITIIMFETYKFDKNQTQMSKTVTQNPNDK